MKKMKKLLAGLMAATMVMSMSITAFADETEKSYTSEPGSAATETTFEFTKVYEKTNPDSGELEVYPAEVLNFSIAADSKNPDGTKISIADQTIGSNPDNILITIPAYTKVGEYYYTVTEDEGNTQGVTYTGGSFGVQVIVTYDENDSTHTKLLKQVTFTTDSTEGKVDTIVNKYDLGELAVKKVVTGNLGSQDVEFKVKVTFNVAEGKTVKSAISYLEDGKEKSVTVEQMADGTETVEIALKHGETITFTNIPAGVSYTVEENSYTEGDVNKADEAYDVAKYTTVESNAATTEDTTKISADIEADDEDKAFIRNNKGTTVDTGISLDNMPYIMVLAMVALGLVGFVSKKRSMEF